MTEHSSIATGLTDATAHHRAVLCDGVVAAGRATVSAASSEAASAGLQVLAEGGNAFDAAVAAGLVETVTLPMKCGLAGDIVAMVRNADGSFQVLQAIGPGAAALDEGAEPTVVGPKSVGVPGAPHGYALLAERGTLPLSRLAAPAIAIARNGFRMSAIASALTGESEALLKRECGETIFLPNGKPPAPGDIMRLGGLADLLEVFVQEKEELFFGEIGQQVAERVQPAGGFISQEDLRCRPGAFVNPDVTQLAGGFSLMTSPAPTHGADLGKLLKTLEGSWGDAAAVFAAFQAHQQKRRDEGTSLVTTSDSQGNAVILIHSNSFPRFGSGLVVEPWHLVLSNRPGRGFTLGVDAGHPNAPKAGRVPRTTLHVWAMTAGDDVWLGATPGGVNQLPWNLQVLAGLLAGERDLGRLVCAPLWGVSDKGEIEFEADHPLTGQKEAGGSGARIAPPLSLRSVEQIIHMQQGKTLRSCAADPRTGTRAAALQGPG